VYRVKRHNEKTVPCGASDYLLDTQAFSLKTHGLFVSKSIIQAFMQSHLGIYTEPSEHLFHILDIEH